MESPSQILFTQDNSNLGNKGTITIIKNCVNTIYRYNWMSGNNKLFML
jgi:hypothetical protein